VLPWCPFTGLSSCDVLQANMALRAHWLVVRPVHRNTLVGHNVCI
jgi:hypothetical protein